MQDGVWRCSAIPVALFVRPTWFALSEEYIRLFTLYTLHTHTHAPQSYIYNNGDDGNDSGGGGATTKVKCCDSERQTNVSTNFAFLLLTSLLLLRCRCTARFFAHFALLAVRIAALHSASYLLHFYFACDYFICTPSSRHSAHSTHTHTPAARPHQHVV